MKFQTSKKKLILISYYKLLQDYQLCGYGYFLYSQLYLKKLQICLRL